MFFTAVNFHLLPTLAAPGTTRHQNPENCLGCSPRKMALVVRDVRGDCSKQKNKNRFWRKETKQKNNQPFRTARGKKLLHRIDCPRTVAKDERHVTTYAHFAIQSVKQGRTKSFPAFSERAVLSWGRSFSRLLCTLNLFLMLLRTNSLLFGHDTFEFHEQDVARPRSEFKTLSRWFSIGR